MKYSMINLNANKCRIGYSWLIVTFFVLSLVLSSCGSPSSVRSQYRKVKEKNEEIKKHYYLEDEKESIAPKNVESPNYSSENDIASIDIKSGSSPKIKIPSLREQMKIYSEEQSIIKGKISNIESDISGIKSTLIEIKENINPPKNVQTAIAGENNQDNIPKEIANKNVPQKSGTILSDEASTLYFKSNKEKISATNEKKKISIVKNNKNNKPEIVEKAQKSNVIKPSEKNEQISKSIDQKGDIESALNLMKQKKYESAIVEFNKIALGSKTNQIITSCSYWIGESYFALNQYDKAAQFFQRVLKSTANFKKDNAQMLLAECYTKIGKTDNAKLAFQSLIDNYPKSIYIPKAKKMLQTL